MTISKFKIQNSKFKIQHSKFNNNIKFHKPYIPLYFLYGLNLLCVP